MMNSIDAIKQEQTTQSKNFTQEFGKQAKALIEMHKQTRMKDKYASDRLVEKAMEDTKLDFIAQVDKLVEKSIKYNTLPAQQQSNRGDIHLLFKQIESLEREVGNNKQLISSLQTRLNDSSEQILTLKTGGSLPPKATLSQYLEPQISSYPNFKTQTQRKLSDLEVKVLDLIIKCEANEKHVIEFDQELQRMEQAMTRHFFH